MARRLRTKKGRADCAGRTAIVEPAFGQMVEERTWLKPTRLQSGPRGGDQQLGARITDGEVNVPIFFGKPLQPQLHDPGLKALLRIAAVRNVAVACHRSPAAYVISSPLLANGCSAALPDVDRHALRVLPDAPGDAPLAPGEPSQLIAARAEPADRRAISQADQVLVGGDRGRRRRSAACPAFWPARSAPMCQAP